MIKKIQNKLLELLKTIPLKDDKPNVVLGLSGGADSVFLYHVLLDLYKQRKIFLNTIHINHGWRKAAADDQQFTMDLTRKGNTLHKVALSQEFEQYVPAHKKANASPESLAREIRRVVYERCLDALHADAIILAHHADDQLETFIMRAIRGSSTAGLAGMRPVEGRYIRPLLDIQKKDIMAWLEENKIKYCYDQTNESDAHLRNRIRKNVMPALLACDSRARTNIASTMARLTQDDELLANLATDVSAAMSDNDGWLTRTTFCDLARPLQVRILQRMLISANAEYTPSTGLFDEIIRFLATPRGGTHTINNVEVVKKQSKFCIQQPQPIQRKQLFSPDQEVTA